MKRLVALLLLLVLIPQAAGADQFHRIQMIVNTGEKGEEQDVILRFDDDAMVVFARSGTELKAFRYEDIKAADYSYSKSPRWKSGIGVAVAVGIFALPIFFMKGRKHWFTVRTDKDFALLRLDKGNYRLVLPTFEAKSGVKIDLVAEDK
jgi:hypothetical protein